MENSSLPQAVLKFFWGDDIRELSWEKYRVYITKTLLEKGDVSALRWLLKRADKDDIRQVLATKKLDKKSQNFWNLYLS